MKPKSKHLLPFLKPNHRTAIKILMDSGLAFVAYGAATVLQRGTLHVDFVPLLGEMIVFSLFSAVMFLTFKTYRAIWSYVSLSDLFRLVVASGLTIIFYFGFREFLFLQLGLPHISFSQPIITGMVMIGALCGFRIIYRLMHFGNLREAKTLGVQKTNILLIGAGDAAELFIRSMKNNPYSAYRILGILDPRDDRQGRTIHGIKVMGMPQDLETVMDTLDVKPQRLIFTTTDDTKKIPLDILIEEAETLGLKFSRLPSLTEFRESDAVAPQLKPIAIEDLLGRPQATIDLNIIKNFIVDQRVLITGAGGSIGSELSRQIASFGPSHLTLVDNCEYNLYAVDLDVRRENGLLDTQSHIADIRNSDRINQIFKTSKPDIVFHAAALKHVPLVEMNPSEGILTNVIGTRNVAEAALKAKAKAFVQISTDKAVNPTNIMGASKRIGEYFAQSLDLAKSNTRFITVRFGNVLGSSGSVVPLFKKQLQAGGPLTVTHADIKRYFMTINEAVGLVLQASACAIEEGDSGRGRILVLDTKEPIKIIDLRAGEKLYEELFDSGETQNNTNIPSTFSANPKPLPKARIKKAMVELEGLAANNDIKGIIACIDGLVPGFNHESHKNER
jgi:FlaA1/EpsC-like NDP-sugar epimerase